MDFVSVNNFDYILFLVRLQLLKVLWLIIVRRLRKESTQDEVALNIAQLAAY